MKKYFYRLLRKYISVYKRPDDRIVEIFPQHNALIQQFASEGAAVVLKEGDASDTYKNITCLDALEDIAQHKPEYILLNGNLHFEEDIQQLLEQLNRACAPSTRLIIVYYSSLWRPLISLATKLRLRLKTPEHNWIAHEDIDNLLLLAGFEPVRRTHRILMPVNIPGISSFANRFLSPLPFIDALNMVNILVAKPVAHRQRKQPPSVSIVVAARNEAGNIEELIRRVPRMGPDDELVLIEGHSKDNTWQVIQEMASKYSSKMKILFAQQGGRGKGDAVRKGFSMASKEILMILDADLSVMPEDLPKFYHALVEGKGEFINGSRLVYPMEAKSMRFLNMLGNKAFALAFSFVLGQRFKDTLCGTKVLYKADYERIARNRSFFGDFDPFGDFDLLFGANRLGLKIIEIPVAYKQRTYGDTNIHRWSHGVLLLRMLLFAIRKMLFI